MKYDIIDALVDLVTAESKMPSLIIISHDAIVEIKKLRAENASLCALATLGRCWLNICNDKAKKGIDRDKIMGNKAIVLDLVTTLGAETPLAKLPEKRE